MDKYKSVRLYFEAEETAAEELTVKFNEDGVVFFDVVSPKVLAVKAFFGGRLDVYEAEAMAEKYGVDYEKIAVVTFCPESHLDLSNPVRISEEQFFTVFDGIQGNYERYRVHYGKKAEDMIIYYASDRGDFLFYGTSLGRVAGVNRLSVPGKRLNIIRYPRFLKKCEEYRKRQGRACVGLAGDISRWLDNSPFESFSAEIRKRVMGQKELDVVLASVYNYLCCIAGNRTACSNILLAAPSGCGKTETFRALRDYFAKQIPGLPVAQVDMSNITEAGFKGADPKEILRSLINAPEAEGIGILFLDEFDKKLIPSFSNAGQNVNAAVQSQLLTMIEGCVMNEGSRSVDTSKTMFVGMGSFDECRKGRDERHLGFGSTQESKNHYSPITRDDIIELGASYELLGRFAVLLNYHPLSYEDVGKIIAQSCKAVSEQLDVEVELSPKALEELHELANGKYGCRAFAGYMQEAVWTAYAQWLCQSEEERSSSHILVQGKGNATVVHVEQAETEEYAEEVS